MPILIGTSTKNQKAIPIGETQINRVYVGDKLVWQKPSSELILGGKTYPQITIGGLIWISENLAYNDSGGGIYYPNNDILNVPDYGYLYTYSAAMRIKSVLTGGWRIPTIDDIDDTQAVLGGSSVAGGKLKETGTTYWNSPNIGATNEVGFNARGAGIMYLNSYYSFRNAMYMVVDDPLYSYLYYSANIVYNTSEWADGAGNPNVLDAWSIRLCKNA